MTLTVQVADSTPELKLPGYSPSDAAGAVRHRAWLYGYRLPRKIVPVYQFHKPSRCWVWRLDIDMAKTRPDTSLTYCVS